MKQKEDTGWQHETWHQERWVFNLVAPLLSNHGNMTLLVKMFIPDILDSIHTQYPVKYWQYQVVLVETPISMCLLPAHRLDHCTTCGRHTFAPLPCTTCTTTNYCRSLSTSHLTPCSWDHKSQRHRKECRPSKPIGAFFCTLKRLLLKVLLRPITTVDA